MNKRIFKACDYAKIELKNLFLYNTRVCLQLAVSDRQQGIYNMKSRVRLHDIDESDGIATPTRAMRQQRQLER